MALHLLPTDDFAPDMVRLEQEEIRLHASNPKPQPPLLRDWFAEPRTQIITHVATGCQFRAYPVSRPLSDGLVTPFAPTYDVAVKFVGTLDGRPLPGDVADIGRQGIEWILRYTYESHRK